MALFFQYEPGYSPSFSIIFDHQHPCHAASLGRGSTAFIRLGEERKRETAAAVGGQRDGTGEQVTAMHIRCSAPSAQ